VGAKEEVSKEKDVAKIIQEWKWNPLKWVRECIQWPEGERLSSQQEEGFEWIGKLARAKFKVNMGGDASKEERGLAKKLGISIRSGHGTGKTAFMALVDWWLLACFPYPIGYVTAPTSHQLEDILWKEFRKWKRQSLLLDDKYEVQSDKVYLKEAKGEWFISARTTNIKGSEDEQAETLSGQHGDYMILGVDEASKVPYGIFKPIEGAMTGLMNFALLIGNPTRSQGYFFDSHTKNRDRWICLHWNSEESPLVSKDLLDSDIKRYGRDSNWYRVRRLGEFPISDSTTFIPYDWVLDAVNREVTTVDTDFAVKGFDPGAGGDETVLLTRVGKKITEILTKNEPDTERLKEWLLMELMDETRPFVICLDPIGIGNHIFYWLDSIEIPNMKAVYPVDVREASSDPNYFRLRDSLFMKVRYDFEKRLTSIPEDDELLGELTTLRSDDPDSTKGKLKLESKKSMRSRGLSSPNKADAFALTYYHDDVYYEKTVKAEEKKKKKKELPINWRVI
jgi:phage terminase large subunit